MSFSIIIIIIIVIIAIVIVMLGQLESELRSGSAPSFYSSSASWRGRIWARCNQCLT